MSSVQLIVAHPLKGDVDVARIDESTQKYLDIKQGDEADIIGELLSGTHTRIKIFNSNSDDNGKGIIRIAQNKMEECNYKVGTKVLVYKSWIKSLKLALSIKASYKKEWVEIEAPELTTESSAVIP